MNESVQESDSQFLAIDRPRPSLRVAGVSFQVAICELRASCPNLQNPTALSEEQLTLTSVSPRW